MPFPVALSGAQETTLATSGYWSRVLCCLNPNTVVFRALSSQVISDTPFLEFTYDTVSVGSYTDVWEGMIAFLSPTTDLRDAVYRGRVRLAPTSDTFYIDLNPTLLSVGTYIIVTRDTDLFDRVRDDTLIDGSIAYHDLPPMLLNHPQCVVLYDSNADGDVTYTPVQTGIPVDAAATTISTWVWSVSGDGTSSINNAALEHPTFTLEAGYHYLIRVIYTDDNGVSNYQITHVYAVTRTFSAPVVRGIVAGSVDGRLDNGWTANVTAYADVSDFVDRTHAVLFSVEHFGDNSSTPIFGNVLMNGRVRSSAIRTEGSIEAGRIQEVGFTIEGIAAYLRRMTIPPDIVRNVAAPNEWGEMVEPNPYRMAVYALWAYTTLTNICSLGVQTGAFSAWQIGDEPRAIEGGNALDVITNLLTPIKAAPNWAPSGEIFLSRTASYEEDRSGLALITTLTLSVLRDYNIDLDSSLIVSQVTGFGGAYDTTLTDFILYSASAPSIPYDGGETRELTRELLTTDSTSTDAQIELGLRISNEFAFENPKPLLSASIFDSYAGVFIPTNYQRWSAVLPAVSNTLNRAWGATDYFQLQSVRLSFSPEGTIDTSAEFYGETSFDDAQTVADQLPDNLDTNPVMPVLPNDPLFPTDPLELYPTDTPTLEELQPIDNGTAGQSYTPMPPEVASEMTRRQGQPGCKTLRVNFKWNTNVTSSWVTVLSADYLMTISGYAQIGINTWQQIFFPSDNGGFSQNPTLPYGTYVSGSPGYWTTTDALALGNYRRSIDIERTGIPSTAFTFVSVNYDWTGGSFSGPIAFVVDIGATRIWEISNTDLTNGTNLVESWSGSVTDTSLRIALNSSVSVTAVYSGSAQFNSLTVRGTGTNPFTGEPGTPLYADGFYQFNLDSEGIPINVSLLSDGLYLDNSKYAEIPAFNPSHRYGNRPFTGTGNPLNARMVFDTYTNNQDAYLFIEMCKA